MDAKANIEKILREKLNLLILILTFLFFCSFSTSICHADDKSPLPDNGSPSTLFSSAEAQWQAKNWMEALADYEGVAAGDPRNAAKAHIQLGKYYKYHGLWNEAIAHYENAIKKALETRDIEDAQTSIAAVYLSKGDYTTSLDQFKSIVSKTKDWQQVKYSCYWIKELKRRMAHGDNADGCKRCGLSSVKEILYMNGMDFSDEELSHADIVGKDGISMGELQKLVQAKGLVAYALKLSLEDLKTIQSPFIALLSEPRHYVIVMGFENGNIRILDPEYSINSYQIPASEFLTKWHGYALVFSEATSEIKGKVISADEINNLLGKVCYCCPESNNGTQVPNTQYENNSFSISGCTTTGMPSVLVNTANLNMIIKDRDLFYSGRGPIIEIARTYNADDSRDGPFGHSWTFNYNMRLAENPNGRIDIRRETGTIHSFTFSSGVYHGPQGVYDTLVKSADGTYALKLKGSKLTQKFDSSGKLTAISDRNGNTISLEYDANDRLISIIDTAGRMTSISYGTNGKINSITDPLGRTASYAYDANNNLISTIDMAGNNVTYTYDSNSYITAITTVKGITQLSYETSSEGYSLKSITDALGNIKSYGTYSSHYVVRIIDNNGNATYYENDFDGYTDKISDTLGSEVSYEYDSYGNRIGITDPKANQTSFTYDGKGNVTGVTDPLGAAVQLTYDSRDNLTRMVDTAGNTYTYEYDGNDNLTRIIDPENGATSFAYNTYGQTTTLTDARGKSIYFLYDTYGNLITATNPLGGIDSYAYDAVGRVFSHQAPNGKVTLYMYDDIDRIKEVRFADGNVKTYTYDCCGANTISDSSGTASFIYDNINRITSYKDYHNHTLSYQYDKTGNLTALTYPDGKIVNYEYDASNRVIKVKDWLNNVTTYSYDPSGNLIKITSPDGSTTIHQYDNANRLKSMLSYKPDGTVISQYNYTLDASGNRTAVSFYQPSAMIPAQKSAAYTYDADNRLLTDGNTTFQFDDNGNVIGENSAGGNVTYAWDNSNMLTQTISGGNTFNYQYDALGNRIAKAAGGEETRYVVDPTGILSQVLAETDAAGNITAYYVYGIGLISKITPDEKAYYYHYDGIGSAIAITDGSGNIVNKYAYDAFGKVASQEETIPNPFKYVGRFGVMDDGNGLLYMRARYYDPEAGRFISKDPIGLAGGMNLYAYTGNNPLSFSDPMGLYTPNNGDYFTRYGNWGGEHWSGGCWIEKGGLGNRSVKPVDWVDAWWKTHDIDSIDNPVGNTDRVKIGALKELMWRKIFLPWTVTPYQEIAVWAFFSFGHD